MKKYIVKNIATGLYLVSGKFFSGCLSEATRFDGTDVCMIKLMFGYPDYGKGLEVIEVS